MTDDKTERPDAERLGEIFRRLGRVFGRAADAVEQAENREGGDAQRAVIETRSSIRTLEGEPVDLGSLVEALGGATQSAREDNSRPLRQVTPEFVIDTPDRLVAVADLPGASSDDVRVSVDGDLMRLEARTSNVDYWAELMLPRDVSSAKLDTSVRNGILNIVWTFSGDT